MQEIIDVIKKHAKHDIYIVGGAVRDLLLHREITDYDFAYAGNAAHFARTLAEKLQASFVLLDEQHDVARVIIKTNHKNNNIFLDFSGLKGTDIIADLRNRDFTINAMAMQLSDDFNIEDCDGKIIDPLNAQKDIAEKNLLAISESNVVDDPCRIMRGIRLSVELGYQITAETMEFFSKNNKALAQISMERIRDEIFKAFTYCAYKTIKLMDQAHVLEVIFPEIFAAQGVTQNKYHTMDVWNHILEVVKQLEQDVLEDKHLITADIKEYLAEELVVGRPKKQLLKFAALVHDVGKPAVRKVHPEKGVIFWNHEHAGAEIAKKISERLMLSNKEIQFISLVVKNHMRPLFLVKSKTGKKAYNNFFKDTGIDGIAILLHAFADSKGGKAPDPDKEKALKEIICTLMGFYYREYLPQQQNPLINGKIILENFPNIKQRKIGEVLNKVQEQRALGRVTTKEQALAFVKEQYDI